MEYFLYATLKRSPVLLVAFAGMVLAVLTWKRHPGISLRTLIGLSLFWAQWLIFTIAFYFGAILANLFGHRQWFETGLYFVQDLVFAVILILLVSAALARRNKPTVPT
ncbi:MAG: hypothetical protein ACRD8U_11550 [Pyrinomonadaceae bacterium]